MKSKVAERMLSKMPQSVKDKVDKFAKYLTISELISIHVGFNILNFYLNFLRFFIYTLDGVELAILEINGRSTFGFYFHKFPENPNINKYLQFSLLFFSWNIYEVIWINDKLVVFLCGIKIKTIFEDGVCK